MHTEQLRNFCLALPGVTESTPFSPDNLVFKIKNRIFLIASLDTVPLQFNVKCNPDIAIDLREKFPCVLPGYHMNKKHWNTIIADGSVSENQLIEWINHSYQLVNSKTS